MPIKKQNIIDFFNNKAIDWDHNNSTADSGAKKIITIFANILKDKHVLDIGCGTGVLTNKLITIGSKKITGIDISKQMISQANKKFTDIDNVNFICKDILDFDPKEKFDVAIMFNVYPHLNKDEQLVNKLFCLLNSNGTLIVAHGSGKQNINNHHKLHAIEVSQQLKSAKEESILWMPKFKIIDTRDDKNLYYFVVEKVTNC